MRERYLKEHKRVLYYTLLTSGKLYEHLAEIDTSACDMADKGNGKKARRYRAIKGCGYDEMDRIDEQYQSLRR